MKTNRIIQKLFLVGAITSLAFVGCDEGQPASRGSADSALASEVGINQDDPEQSRPERARVSLAVEESSLDLSGGLELIETFEPAASIVAAPAIWNNLLLFGTTSGALVSHDLETDAVVYRRKVDGPILSLAVTGTTLVVVTDEQVVAFVPGDGAQLWEYPLDSVPSSRVTLTARSLYLGLANGRVIALDPESGELRWETRVDHALVDRLVVDAGVAYGMGEEGLLYGLDTSTGANVSQWDLGGGGMFVAAPGQADGRLVASGRDGRVVLVSLSENQSVLSTSAGTNGLFTPLALDDQLIVVAGERTLRSLVLPLTQSDADIRWSLELDGQVFGSPFLVGDNIIVPTENELVSIALSDGSITDQLALPASPSSPISVFEEQVLLALGDGTVVLASVDAEEGEIPLFTGRGVWNLPPTGRFRLADPQVSLRMQSPRDAVFDITVTAEPTEDLLLRVLGPEGEEVATNMGKVELTRTVRAPLAAQTPYVLRIERPNAAGEATITIATELIE